MTHNNAKKGFTLIEMSIVLVVIGLIIGGITVGQSLLRQSQIESAISDIQRYTQAVQSFQTKYGALPGDFAGAVGLWGGGTSNCTGSPYAPASGAPPATCNGDGNGQIGISGTTTSYPPETIWFWEHLYDGQFIQGAFNGTPGSGGSGDYNFGVNAPLSRLKGASYQPLWVGVPSGTPYFSSTFNYGHVFFIGGYVSNAKLTANVLKTAEAGLIDAKYDDGVPSTGNFQTWLNGNAAGYSTTCATSSLLYNTAASGLLCSMIFVTGF